MNTKSINLLLIVSLTIFSTSLFAQKERGSGNVTEQERNLSGFNAIDVASGVDVFIMQGSTEKVVVKTDDNFQDNVQAEVHDNVLELRLKGNIHNPKELAVYVTVKNLSKINASSGSDVFSKGTLSFDKLEVNMVSGSDLKMDVEGNTLYCHLAGGSDVFLKGTVKNLEVEALGGSDIKAKDLKAGDCKLRVRGGSDAFVHVSGELDMEASGASDIHYSGNASVVHSKASGASDIIGN